MLSIPLGLKDIAPLLPPRNEKTGREKADLGCREKHPEKMVILGRQVWSGGMGFVPFTGLELGAESAALGKVPFLRGRKD